MVGRKAENDEQKPRYNREERAARINKVKRGEKRQRKAGDCTKQTTRKRRRETSKTKVQGDVQEGGR